MGKPRARLARRALAAACGAAILLGALCAQAATDGPVDGQEPTRALFVAKDKSAGFRLDYPVSQIVVAQPDMLQLVATTDRSFYVRGKAIGTTNLLIYDRQHHLAQVIILGYGGPRLRLRPLEREGDLAAVGV